MSSYAIILIPYGLIVGVLLTGFWLSSVSNLAQRLARGDPAMFDDFLMVGVEIGFWFWLAGVGSILIALFLTGTDAVFAALAVFAVLVVEAWDMVAVIRRWYRLYERDVQREPDRKPYNLFHEWVSRRTKVIH